MKTLIPTVPFEGRFLGDINNQKRFSVLPPTVEELWLNGNERNDDIVTYGNSHCCAGCGCCLGIFTVAITGDEKPVPSPVFPFKFDNCPLCKLRDELRELDYQHRNCSLSPKTPLGRNFPPSRLPE